MLLGSVNMRECIRSKLQQILVKGFWFPIFQSFIELLIKRLSLCYKFKRWISDGEDAPRGAAEIYQLAFTLIALVWLIFIPDMLNLFRCIRFIRFVSFVFSYYFIIEIMVFSLDWIFVADKPLKSYQRSLATFLLNIVQVAFLFSILFVLYDCHPLETTTIESIGENLNALFTIQLISVCDSSACIILSKLQRLVGGILMVIIVASLVGAVVREEEKEMKNNALAGDD